MKQQRAPLHGSGLTAVGPADGPGRGAAPGAGIGVVLKATHRGRQE